MNEICIENCAQKRDCSGLELKPGDNLLNSRRYPIDQINEFTKDEKFTSLAVYVAMTVDYLKAVQNEPPTLLEDRILTAKQVAEYLQISKSKIYYLISRRELPHLRLGRNVRVRQSDLMKWLELQIERVN